MLKMTGLVSQGQEAAWWPQCEAEAVPCVPDTPCPAFRAQASEGSTKQRALSAWPLLCVLSFHNQLIKPTRVMEGRRFWVFVGNPSSLPPAPTRFSGENIETGGALEMITAAVPVLPEGTGVGTESFEVQKRNTEQLGVLSPGTLPAMSCCPSLWNGWLPSAHSTFAPSCQQTWLSPEPSKENARGPP